jgi:hypothetical protein
MLADEGEMMRLARVTPEEVDPRVVGMRVYGIRRRSSPGPSPSARSRARVR